MGMTPKQREFARLYAASPVVMTAAEGAGYAKNYAKSGALKLLENPDIVAEIQRVRLRLNERAEKSSTDVVNEYSKIAFTDRYDFIKDDPDFPGHHIYKAPDELTSDQRAICISIKPSWRTRKRIVDGVEIEVQRQEWEYRFADKENALQQMGRHFGIFDDKLRLSTSGQNPFKNATPEQLENLKQSWVETMNGGAKAIKGSYEEIK